MKAVHLLKLFLAAVALGLIGALLVATPVILWLVFPTSADVIGLAMLGSALVFGAGVYVWRKSRNAPRSHALRARYSVSSAPVIEPQRRTYRRMVNRRPVEFDADTGQPVRQLSSNYAEWNVNG